MLGMRMARKVQKSEEEWRRELSREENQVVRRKGTEPPFTGEYYDHWERGAYLCAGCGRELFSSEDKFDSGSGWPSFTRPVGELEERRDLGHGMIRTEVLCPDCGGHLGHVFRDGPAPTGLRYCINSVSLKFRKRE
jgi:peptide-methionine (R)-S-oxide reductase